MFCKKCGEYINDTAQFCTHCGARQDQNLPQQIVNPIEACKLFVTRCTDFGGRSRRSEYWWAYLFISMILGGIVTSILGEYSWIWSLIILVPAMSLSIRRLHDTGKSGWFLLWNLLPLIGQIIVIIRFCKDSAPDNQWGPNPKGYRS